MTKHQHESNDMPCGNCDMGTYSEMAMLNRKAREFSVLTEEQRQAQMPMCKKHNRVCVGSNHFSQAISQIDKETEHVETKEQRMARFAKRMPALREKFNVIKEKKYIERRLRENGIDIEQLEEGE